MSKHGQKIRYSSLIFIKWLLHLRLAYPWLPFNHSEGMINPSEREWMNGSRMNIRELRHTRINITFVASAYTRQWCIVWLGSHWIVRGATRPLNSIRMYLFSELCVWMEPVRSAPANTHTISHHAQRTHVGLSNGNKSLFILFGLVLWKNCELIIIIIMSNHHVRLNWLFSFFAVAAYIQWPE